MQIVADTHIITYVETVIVPVYFHGGAMERVICLSTNLSLCPLTAFLKISKFNRKIKL